MNHNKLIPNKKSDLLIDIETKLCLMLQDQKTFKRNYQSVINFLNSQDSLNLTETLRLLKVIFG